MYTIDDEGLEEDGAVVGLAGEFVNHAYWRPVRQERPVKIDKERSVYLGRHGGRDGE